MRSILVLGILAASLVASAGTGIASLSPVGGAVNEAFAARDAAVALAIGEVEGADDKAAENVELATVFAEDSGNNAQSAAALIVHLAGNAVPVEDATDIAYALTGDSQDVAQGAVGLFGGIGGSILGAAQTVATMQAEALVASADIADDLHTCTGEPDATAAAACTLDAVDAISTLLIGA